ncbi:hypothetical protein [Actinomadura rugatobispora]|uniref:Uncharacterized protein n=1 Tax=Actinomadura rugatobispora TaxID=1994 RepID=A0ABW1A232_9ACTN
MPPSQEPLGVGPLSPTLPPAPPGPPSVPPPLTLPSPPPMPPPMPPRLATNGTGLALVGQESDQRDWAAVFGAALVTEVGLLWMLACLLVLRRRWTLVRLRHTR